MSAGSEVDQLRWVIYIGRVVKISSLKPSDIDEHITRSLFACQRRKHRDPVLSLSGIRSCYRIGQGLACQISAAYSAIVRSLENCPELAMLRIALRAQPSGSAYKSSSCRSEAK